MGGSYTHRAVASRKSVGAGGQGLSIWQPGQGHGTNRALFETLAKHGWIPEALAQGLARVAGFRNILVHGYTEVDPTVVRDVLENHLGDLDAFVAAVRGRL